MPDSSCFKPRREETPEYGWIFSTRDLRTEGLFEESIPFFMHQDDLNLHLNPKQTSLNMSTNKGKQPETSMLQLCLLRGSWDMGVSN